MKRQSGFTLIELIIVIVILGILAVTAAPQFFNFGSDARTSTVRGLEGAIKAASELVHARAQISPTADSVRVRETEGEGSVAVSGLYAVAGSGGIALALSLSDGDWETVSEVAEPGVTIAWRPSSVAESDNWSIGSNVGCFAYYTWDSEDQDQSEPQIGSVTTSC